MNRGCPKGGVAAGLALALFLFPGALRAETEGAAIARAWGGPFAQEVSRSLALLPEEDAFRQAALQALSRMASAGFSPGDARAFLRLAEDLSRAGISLLDLGNKVQEGVAKGASPERIMVILEERASRLKGARTLVLGLESEGVVFLDRQMAYRVLADYLSRGIPGPDLAERVARRDLKDFPALDNVIR